MRQVVLDTETTGLEPEGGHRIIEIGGVEVIDRRVSGRVFHTYINPEREIDEGAQAVHGLSLDDLRAKPRFAQIAETFLEFVAGAELVIHNAAFDIAFIDAELGRLDPSPGRTSALVAGVIDSLALARKKHPGQKNSLDALCRRYAVDDSHRTLHGALLDAQLLAEVYLAMTGGQTSLVLTSEDDLPRAQAETALRRPIRERPPLRVVRATLDELEAHASWRTLLAKSGRDLWADVVDAER